MALMERVREKFGGGATDSISIGEHAAGLRDAVRERAEELATLRASRAATQERKTELLAESELFNVDNRAEVQRLTAEEARLAQRIEAKAAALRQQQLILTEVERRERDAQAAETRRRYEESAARYRRVWAERLEPLWREVAAVQQELATLRDEHDDARRSPFLARHDGVAAPSLLVTDDGRDELSAGPVDVAAWLESRGYTV